MTSRVEGRISTGPTRNDLSRARSAARGARFYAGPATIIESSAKNLRVIRQTPPVWPILARTRTGRNKRCVRVPNQVEARKF
jgi:hypothetical protein